MTYVVALLADRWGSERGGTNVFNTGLATAMPSVLTKHSRTLCFVEELPGSDVRIPDGVDLLQHQRNPTELAQQLQRICDELKEKSLQGVLVVGHDVFTGPLAIECVQKLRILLGHAVPVASAAITHMDYWEYSGQKGKPLDEVAHKREAQRLVVLNADYAYAVGPLLTANFSSARQVKRCNSSPLRGLIPGAAEIQPSEYDPRTSLQFFISGRLTPDDEPIKNGVLVIRSLIRAYDERRALNEPQWTDRGRLIAYGFEDKESGRVASLQQMADANARFRIEPVAFSPDQAKMFRHLADCHIALMPSWHEGFGLSGWEALCAGVPLLCSRQSGLARFLEELKASRPGLSLDSVEFVNLSGSNDPSASSERDVQLVSHALIEMVKSLELRKEAALRLARTLKEFTWKRCASDLLDSVDRWYLPGSVHWGARQKFATEEVRKAEGSVTPEEVLDRIMDRLDSLNIVDDWQDLTTAFNYLSDLGTNANRIGRQKHLEQLGKIGDAVSVLLDVRDDLQTRMNSGLMDVCWRYMAACSAISYDFSDFISLFPEPLAQTIWSDSFLAREMLHYAKPFSEEFEDAPELAASLFSPLPNVVATRKTVAQRIARLASTRPSYGKIVGGIESNETYALEARRCAACLHAAHDVALEVAKDPSMMPTVLAQMSFSTDPARQVADQARAFIKAYFPETDKVEGHWRGDKRLNAALATASLPTGAVLAALNYMANDEDESIRWAALHLAFSPILRLRLEASMLAGALDLKVSLNEALGKVVDDAVKFDSGHYWLCREFIMHFQNEWGPDSALASGHRPEKFTLFDFPVARSLFGPVIGEAMPSLEGAHHPEVHYFREAAQESIRRVLLVLPPINSPQEAARAASSTSTPPLGLGLLATHLASQGHDVQIADCHRFPELAREVINMSWTFDLIGFNAVFTTVKPIVQMLAEIRSRSAHAILVVGGPAAKLRAWKQAAGKSGDGSQNWDFAISDNAEDNLTLLVKSLELDDPWPEAFGLEANPQSAALSPRDLENKAIDQRSTGRSDWKEIVLDRRVFRAKGRQYEPSRTRSRAQEVYQAHVVMSQGCNWNCVFCTERSSVSGGERRRIVEDVLSEVARLAHAYENLNIQFIDDNLLPQIGILDPTSVIERARSEDWATQFLEGLGRIRSSSRGSFGWRGIFRLEDFFAYETALGQERFYRLLSCSGCRMLAFGIEQGDEEQRMRSKAGSSVIPNHRISSLFERLYGADILTKAYFILGGPWESRESALRAIDFALESKVTLAYFALYKDFTRAAQTLSRLHPKQDRAGEEFLDYRQLAMNWDAAFGGVQSSGAGAGAGAGTEGAGSLLLPATESERECYAELAALGFSFFDVVKYNDFHSYEGASGSLLNAVTWSSPDEYFSIVEMAYRRFYLRPEFVTSYKSLLLHGY